MSYLITQIVMLPIINSHKIHSENLVKTKSIFFRPFFEKLFFQVVVIKCMFSANHSNEIKLIKLNLKLTYFVIFTSYNNFLDPCLI